MTRPVIVRPAAEADLQTTYHEMVLIQPKLGRRFITRVREVLERIELMPELYAVVWHDVRAVRLKTFRHVVYYVVFTDRVEVLAILHGARDASTWKSRV